MPKVEIRCHVTAQATKYRLLLFFIFLKQIIGPTSFSAIVLVNFNRVLIILGKNHSIFYRIVHLRQILIIEYLLHCCIK